MAHGQYLLVLALCLLVTLPLEFVFAARVYRRPRALAGALLGVLMVFAIWDAVAIAHHLWHYNPAFVVGWTLPFGLPLEEVLFFLVVPLCGLLTYEAIGTVLARASRHRRRAG